MQFVDRDELIVDRASVYGFTIPAGAERTKSDAAIITIPSATTVKGAQVSLLEASILGF